MRQFFNIRIYTGFFLALAVIALLVFSLFQSGREKPDRIFTENINRIHQNTLAKLNTSKELKVLNLSVPVFIYNQKDSLIFWSEETIPCPDSLLHSPDTVFTFSHQDMAGLIFKNTGAQFKYFIYVPVTPGGYTKRILPGFYSLTKKTTPAYLTYNGKHKFKLSYQPNINSFGDLSWLIVILIFSSVMLLAPWITKSIQKISGFKSPEAGMTLPIGVITLVIILLDLLDALPSDWFLASDFIKGIIPLSPFSLILVSILGIFLTSYLTKLKRFPVNNKPFTNRSVPVLFLCIGLVAVLAVNLTRFIYLQGPQNFNLERLFSVSLKEIVVLLILLFFFTLCILLIQWLYSMIHRMASGLNVKLLSIATTVFILFLLQLAGWINVPFAPFILGFLILIVLLDLYFDRKGFSSNWVLTWMIVISAFLSFIIFHADLRKDVLERQVALNNSLFERNKDLEKQISDQNKSTVNPYSEDTVFVVDSKLSHTLGAMAKIGNSLYFDPLNGSYFSLFTKEKNPAFLPIILYHRTDLNDKTISNPESRLSGIHKSWTGESAIDFPSKDSIWSEKGISYVCCFNNSGYAVISEQKIPGLLRPVSLFAALFFIISIGLFLISLMDARMHMLPAGLNLRFFHQKSLRSRIQMSILGLTIIAFIVVGFVSANYFKKIHTIQIEELAMAKALAMQRELQSSFDGLPEMEGKRDQINAFIIPFVPAGSDQQLWIETSAEPRNLLNALPSSTQKIRIPFNFNSGHQNNAPLLVESQLAKNKNGVYIPLDINGSTQYFFSPVYLDDDMHGKISDLLATFLSIYAVLFMLSVIIAIGLANSITNPIELLGQKLKGLKLSRKNETVEWQNEDEIGTLIGIYNEMINKLGDNAKLMAKIERDSAWKEMAQQVAHEIKNPLTPLKLNIQYLESKVGSNPEIAPQLIAQLAPSLIEQIDNLSQIASEFSNFAQLPDARNEKLNLNDIVKKVHDFFRKREDMHFKLVLPINDVLVFADKNHMVRILNNVIKNAIQAIPEERPGRIAITLYRQESNAVIRVSDNGTGIPEHMREKVFSPNFTTKSSGTGLGLAIAINMLESFGGRIYFETEENEGSDFFIEIPLMRLEDNFPQTNRVVLED